MRSGHLTSIALVFVCACGGNAEPMDGGPDAARADASSSRDARTIEDSAGFALAPSVPHAYEASDAIVGGPERGFYRFVEVTEETDLDWARAGGHRLIYSYVRLDAYRDASIAPSLFADLERGLALARAAGLKLVLRFAYNDGPYPDSEPDAPLARVLEHIEEVTPILRANADVIAIVQAGFIGAWGEWHTSTSGLLDDPRTRRTIVEALLDALPPERSTQIRYPLYKEEMYGPPRTEASAFDGSYASRVGHHNDCFVSSETDVGTYPDDAIDRWRDYVAADTAFVPMGGETCAVFPARSDCAPAMAEMERLHFSFLNEDYHPEVVQRWRDQGCYDDIARRLGYRLVVRAAAFPDAVRPGGAFLFETRVSNEGWAAPFNPRAPTLVIRRGDDRVEATIDHVDVRRWLGGDEHELRAIVELPADLALGEHELGLALFDPSPSLRARPDAALPFANASGFDGTSGVMILGTLRIDHAAPGDARSDAGALEARAP